MPSGLEIDLAGEPSGGSDLPPGAEPFVILKQEVALEVNFREKKVRGVSTIHLFTINPDLEEITLDARQCEIDLENVTVDGYKTKARFNDPYDLMQAPTQWQLGALQHHVMKKRMQPLRPKHRPEVPNIDREKLPCCVPADKALKISLRPEGKSKEEPRRTLKIKTARVDKDLPVDRPDPNDEKNGIKISIPFRSKTIRDGLHFVGVEEGDLRYPHVYTRHSVEPGTASCIFPCVDDPGSRHPWKISIKCPRTLGDVFEQPLATQSASAQPASGNRKRKAGEAAPAPPPSPITALSEEDKLMEMTVVCSGNLAGEQIDPQDDKKKIMTFESQLSAAQHIAFAIGPFEHIQLWSEFRTEEADEKLGANAAKIHGYCLPGRAPEVLHTCYPIVAAADYFAPEFGRYPFESYKIVFVEDMIPDTSAATSMSLCSTRLLYPGDIQDTEIEVTRKLVHALASQYFGVHIVPNQRSDTWLVVGIQWFMTDMFMKTICGNNWYREHTKRFSDKLVKLDVGRPALQDLGEHLYIGDFELEFMSLKAPLVLFILDTRMSKIAGSTGIARIISTIVSNANIATTIPSTSLSQADFRRTCEKRSSYRPDELWDQYVRGCGCPKLSVKQKFNKKNLNVDITITQTQASENPHREITKEDFFRELEEDIHEVWITPVPKLFTGPFTIRIHEADGTPYEHYLAITDKDKAATALQIAYNTKYKRMKRTKKATAAAANTSVEKNADIQEDDVVYFNMLGDILQSPRDIENWGLQDWAETTQAQMDQESYEWIRLDCNFEWLCEMITDMPPYMYLAQLQQDRDVVAHQDAMLYWKRARGGGILATIETRTAMDRRYYHGIRTMAIEDLPKMADPDLNYIGTVHLILIFRHFFCDRIPGKNGAKETFPPAPNDFSDKAQYAVQCAIPTAIARTREKGRCSQAARAFLLDLILFNDNSENEYSDHFYVAKLLEALTTSVIPDKVDRGGRDLLSSLGAEDDDASLEFKRFIEKTNEVIDKYRRMDEWTSTYQNIWTTTALDCKMRLMKARVIPTNPLEFVQYLQDDNLDFVRIKAFECLVELGMLAKGPIMKLLMASVSTDPSPFVRDRLFKVLCKGMAAIALGENKARQAEPEVIVDDSGLVIEQGEAEIQQRKLDATRNQDVREAIKALKEELKGNTELQAVFWKATESPYISAKEKLHLLDLCYAMFEPDDSLLVTLQYPKYWVATREPAITVGQIPAKKQCIIRFSTHYRTTPRTQLVRNPLIRSQLLEEDVPPPPSPHPQLEVKPPEPKKIKLSSKPSFSGPSVSNPPTPLPAPRKDSISVLPRAAVAQVIGTPSSDSIQVQSFARHSTPLKGTPPPVHASPAPSTNAITKPTDKRLKPSVKKRKSDEAEGFDRNRPPKKLARTENGRPSKVVTVKFRAWNKLHERIQRRIKPAGSTIVATPALKRPGFGFSRPGSHSSHSRTPSRLGSPAPTSSRAGSPAIVKLPPPSTAPKPRKPLPTGAPSTPTVATPKAPASEPPKKLIKLKLKSTSQASPPPGPR